MPFSGGTKTGQPYLRQQYLRQQQYLPKLLGSRIRVVGMILKKGQSGSGLQGFRKAVAS